MTTERGMTGRASYLEPPRALQLRRLAVLRIMLRPRLTARLLGALADEAELGRLAVGTAIKACAASHVPRR